MYRATFSYRIIDRCNATLRSLEHGGRKEISVAVFANMKYRRFVVMVVAQLPRKPFMSGILLLVVPRRRREIRPSWLHARYPSRLYTLGMKAIPRTVAGYTGQRCYSLDFRRYNGEVLWARRFAKTRRDLENKKLAFLSSLHRQVFSIGCPVSVS